MAFRFRRTLRIAPGIRLNLGKRGVSLSLGPRGASVTIGQRGTHANVGLPGTGLSYRKRLDTPAERGRAERHRGRERREQAHAEARRQAEALAQVSLSLGERGELITKDEHGEALSRKHRRLLWKPSASAASRSACARMRA